MKHVELIKKLLRLARDKAASPAEAAIALNRAMELIERHKVDLAALDLDEPTENLVRENISCGARVSLAKFLIATAILQGHFTVRICIVSVKKFDTRKWRNVVEKDIAILGLESDVAIARYVFDFLVGAVSRALSEWAKQEKKARRVVSGSKKDSFTRGWVRGCASNLKAPAAPPELADSRTALVFADAERRLTEFEQATFPNATTITREPARRNWTAWQKGWVEGKDTSIHTPLAGTAPEQLALC